MKVKLMYFRWCTQYQSNSLCIHPISVGALVVLKCMEVFGVGIFRHNTCPCPRSFTMKYSFFQLTKVNIGLGNGEAQKLAGWIAGSDHK
jgi:hypothetical protein